MKKSNRFLIMTVLLLLISSAVFAQRIIKVIPGYILIDTNKNLGKLNDLIKIYRQTDDGLIFIGKAKILKFSQEQIGAKIIFIKKGYSIQTSDWVGRNGADTIDIPLINTNGVEKILKEPKNQGENPQPDNPKKQPQSFNGSIKKKSASSERPEKTIFRDRHDNGYIHMGLFIPGSQMDGLTNNSFAIGFSYNFTPTQIHGWFLDFTYPILTNKTSNIQSSLFILQFFDHIRLGERMHYDLGLGLYFLSTKLSNTSVDEKGSYFGFSLGFSLNSTIINNIALTPSVRCHTFKVDDNWNVFGLLELNAHFTLFQ